MSRRIIQFCYRLEFGDSISNYMFYLERIFKNNGYVSILSSVHIDKNLNEKYEIILFENLKISADDILIYHNCGQYQYALSFYKLNCYKIFFFHNETPPIFYLDYIRQISNNFDNINNIQYIDIFHSAVKAFVELKKVLPLFNTAWTNSNYNASCLKRLGFNNNISILPVPFRKDKKNVIPSYSIINKYSDTKNILFVGRIISNKKQIDIIKAFAYYHKIVPESRLFLIGKIGFSDNYREEFIDYGKTLGLKDCIYMPGKVSYEDLEAYWQSASLFLSMSEHEGFCVPILEALAHEVPVLAYASSAIPETLGDAGILFYEKNFSYIAEVMNAIIENPERVNALKIAGRERIKIFDPDILEKQIISLIKKCVDNSYL